MTGRLPINSAPVSVAHESDESQTNNHLGDGSRSLEPESSVATPGFDLDDHRLQPSSLPRANSDNAARPRRGTFASNYNERPEFLSADHGPITRDFDQAITDDDKSIVGSPTEGGVRRKNTFRRHRQSVSRGSSRSSSTSAPNSVHAFAEHSRRRERAGTATSKAPSIEMQLYRTASRETNRRRPTFSGSAREPSIRAEETGPDAAENDVCYPQSDEESHDGSIDFEELEEFVAETEQGKVPTAPTSPEIIPKITKEAATPDRPATPIVSSDEDFTELEKPAIAQRSDSVNTSRRPSQPEINKRWWTFFSSDFDDAIHSTTIGGLLTEGDTFQNLFSLRSDGGCWWLDGLNATEDEVTALCKAFGVHPLTQEDIYSQESREKVELFKKYYFVSFRSFNQDKESEDFLEPVNIYAVVFRNGVLSFSFGNKNPHPGNVLKRIGKLRDYLQVSADWIAYAFIDDIVDSFNPFVHDVELEVDAIEDAVFTSRPEDARSVLQMIGECRKKDISLLRLLGTKSDVIKGFAKRCNEGYDVAPRGDVGLYLSDIQDHVLSMRENLTHSEQLLSRVHNNYLAQVNVDHINSGNRVNKMLSKITLLASILVPLNLVTGLFGMNVNLPLYPRLLHAPNKLSRCRFLEGRRRVLRGSLESLAVLCFSPSS